MARFSDRFRFHPSMTPSDWPSIAEPRHSVTLSLESVFTGNDNFQDADELVLGLLARSFPPEVPLIAINYNHYACWFWPHRFLLTRRDWPAAWAVHPTPNGDYSVVLTEDMESGTFGHPWEQSLCVFGQGLVEAAPALISHWPVLRQRD